MRYFDLHCDTITECYDKKLTLLSNELALNFKHIDCFHNWCQFFAIFIRDDVRGEQAFRYFCNVADFFEQQIQSFNKVKFCKTKNDLIIAEKEQKMGAFLSIESSAALGGNIENVKVFAEKGVKLATLTWNGENELGYGVSNNLGLSDFGKQVVKEYEKHNIIIDVSHISDTGFYDICEETSAPIIASHSNSREVCNNKRNLTKHQFLEIKKRGGLVGINFYKAFLNDKNYENANIDDIIKHIEYFLSYGGENIICMGSDYDGAEVPYEIRSVYDVYKIKERMQQLNYSDSLIDNIMFKNAYNFFLNHLN